MTTESTHHVTDMIADNSRATRDALSAKRVFGEPYTAGGRTIIPVATVSGGAGGGGGEGTKENEAGNGAGSGFGLTARPVGVYVVDEDGVDWRPAVDATRLARGGQVLAGILAVCLTVVFWRR
ncbi:MAG: spore germination protein GerW family protein, partial [Actinomycetota bacterium]